MRGGALENGFHGCHPDPSSQRHTQASASVFPLGWLLQAQNQGLGIPIWAVPLMGCVTLGQLLNLGVLCPQL